MRYLFSTIVVAIALAGLGAAEPLSVACLFEDDAEGLLKVLTNPTGDPGEGHPEKVMVFSGTTSIKIVPMQRFSPRIEGWQFRITERPRPGEYRFLRFAWKADGCDGVMLQMHDERDWYIRYTAGQNVMGWTSKFVADKAPAEWTVVTVDLFGDFGERTLRGIALTAFGGRAAYFDHVYLGRTIDDLDHVDATGLPQRGKPLDVSAEKLAACWDDLGSGKAERSYLAFWTLVAGGQSAAHFLEAKLAGNAAKVEEKQLRQWVMELDHERFAVREAASRNLAGHLDAAAPLLTKELERGASTEARTRIERLLAKQAADPETARRQKGRRALAEIQARGADPR
ncbi:MAG: hypothetical protein ACJ8F7_09505 [Gemmataceae bacterium]